MLVKLKRVKLLWACALALTLSYCASAKVIDNRYIVVLKSSPSASESSVLKHSSISLAEEQNRMIETLKGRNSSIEVHRQFKTLINAIDVTADESGLDLIKSLSQVERVYPVRLRYSHLDQSHTVTKTAEAWQLLGGVSEAGRGVKIAIIDSGIRPENPMFSDDGFEAPDLSSNEWLSQNPDYCRSPDGDANFCNNKIIIARYSMPTDDIFYSEEDLTPLDTNGHGSHVAGIAAGNPVRVEFDSVEVDIAGVAPGAQLMVYKALFNSGGLLIGSDSMLLEALENAVNDGADIINNSWGAIQDGSPEDSVFSDVFRRAEELGVVMVSSAGNTGAVTAAINCPGCIESGITVANSMHGRVFAHQITIGEERFAATTGQNILSFEDKSLDLISLDSLSDEAIDVCASLPNMSLVGKAPLIRYSNQCLLETIVANTMNAGAEALLLYQDTLSDFDLVRPFNQFENEFDIPLFGLFFNDAQKLKEMVSDGERQITISGVRVPLVNKELNNILYPGSSTGPNSNPNVLKPDIIAPGTDILSASAPQPDVVFPFASAIAETAPVFALKTGTSMSTPMISGAAALIRQQNYGWSAKWIKSALTSTANDSVQKLQGNTSPFEVGAGMLDIPAALGTKVVFESNSHAHGSCVGQCRFDNRITNVSAAPVNVYVDAVFSDVNAEYSIDIASAQLTERGTIGDSQSFSMTVNTSNVPPGTWVYGDIRISTDGDHTNTIPIAIYANDNSDTRALSSSVTHIDTEKLKATTRVSNIDFTRSPSLRIGLSGNASFIEGSVEAVVTNGKTTRVGISEEGNLRWSGNLLEGEMTLFESPSLDIGSLAERGALPIACDNGCFNFSTTIDFPFVYHGESYSGLTVSSNGFIIAGKRDLGPFDANQGLKLPSADNINNVIAPLWSDFDLLDPNDPSDSGSGSIYVQEISLDGIQYLVVEWNELAPTGFFEEEMNTYTFQVIIKKNSHELWFRYVDIPSSLNALIGAENSDATLGTTYFNGIEGTPLPVPISDIPFSLALDVSPAGVLDLNYEIEFPSSLVVTKPDSVSTLEDVPVEFDVLSNDMGNFDLIIEADLAAQESILSAQRLVKLPSTGIDASSLSVSKQPSNGTASVFDGWIRYVPNQDFFGLDSLSYSVAGNGDTRVEQKVNISVVPINDAPTLQNIASQTVQSGESVIIGLKGIDVDDDALTWDWSQVDGPRIRSFQENIGWDTFQLEVVTPYVSQSTELVFSITTSDGIEVSLPVLARVRVMPSEQQQTSSGGSITIYTLGALLMLVWRRRIH
ncbi:S8 family serine peptidase [Ningiella sp. W23]|uniref:S8 family serine peptidase n=1 Tax=Ningiella sp. W23 TaxID=3023715 RepID=UPI00375652CA